MWRAGDDDSVERFQALAEAAYWRLPEGFRGAVGNLVIQVRDFADPGTLRHMGIANAYDLLGLYHGIDLKRQSVNDSGRLPAMIFLYRQPILAYAKRETVSLESAVTHVLVHELGHHFGFSDAEMHAIEGGDHE